MRIPSRVRATWVGITMDDVPVVGRSHCVGQGKGDLQKASEGESLLGNLLIEGFPLHQTHGQEVGPLGFLHRVDGDDAGMIQSGQGLGLLPEASQKRGIRGQLGRQGLERHLAPQPRVPSAIHLPHAPGAQGSQDLVVGKGLGAHKGIVRGRRG
jgi:hypothetical protein